MPTPTLMHWQGLDVEVSANGDLGQMVLRKTGLVLLRHLAVDLPAPWSLEESQVLEGEIEQRWTHRAGAEAIVRQVFDETWSLRVTLVNRSGEAVQVPSPRVRFASPWPTRRWLAGGEASISLDAGGPEQLVLTQLRGQTRALNGEIRLAPEPLDLAPAGQNGPGQFLSSWRGVWLANQAQAARVLPRWWPARVAMPSGEEVVLGLPDAGISADAGVNLITDDEDTWISAEAGRHVVRVHDRLGITDVELWWALPVETAQHQVVSRLLQTTDPRTCLPWEAWIITSAVPVLGLGQVQDYLHTAVEELVARSGPAHPLDVMSVAAQLARTPDDDLWAGLEELVTRMPTQPGSQLALVHTRLLAMQQGRVSTVLGASAPPHDLSVVESAMCQVERAVLMPGEEPDETAWRVAGLLGAGLPGDTVGLVRLAQVHALTSLFPEHWDFTTRWPVPLSVAREVVAHRVLASLDDENGVEALAWLLAGS